MCVCVCVCVCYHIIYGNESASQSPDPDPEGIQSRPASIYFFKSTNYVSYFDKHVKLINHFFSFYISFWRWSEMKAKPRN